MRKNYLKALALVVGLLGYSTSSIAQYCTFTGSSSSYFINNFSTTGGVTNITNNASGFTTGGYNDATAMSVGQFAGASVNFSASFGGGGYTYGFNIWVDWNNNQVFDAAEKMYGSGGYVSSANGTITVPLGTAVGTYRMRTVANYLSTNPAACGSASGEAEDYTFTVTTPPSCMPVSALTLASASSNTADISWTAGGTETSWNIEWGAPGFTPGTGTGIGTVTWPSTAYQITGLTANTNYDIYVQADCGGGDLATWKGPLSIYTGYCVPTSTSNSSYYITGVSTTGAVHNLNRTGTGLGTNGYSDYTATDTLTVYPGQQIDFTLSHPSSTYGYVAWVDWNNNFSFADAGDQIFSTGYQSSPYTTSYTIPLTAPLTTTRLRIRNAYVSNPAPVCGNFNSGEAEDYIIKVVAIPSCVPVTGLTLTNVTSSTADITWTAGGSESSWNIEWGAPGYAPGTGAEAGAGSFPSTAYTLNGLMANTTYDVYVQSDCGSGDLATWSGPITLTTGQIPVTVFPYIQDWETGGTDWSLNNGTQANKWVVGTAVANGGTKSLYISNDGGISYSYNTGSTSATHSYRDFAFPAIAPEMKLIFDWKAVGETTSWDKLRVFITPTSYIPTPGTKIITSGTAPTGIIQIGSVNYNGNNSFTTENLTIPAAYAGNNARIILEWSNDGGGGTNPPAAVDNFKVLVLTCPDISGLAIDNFGLDTMQISWTAGGLETSWNVEWGAPGFAPGTGAQTGAGTSPTTTYTIHGLLPSTDYDIYVQADCSGGDYSYWTLVQGATLCAPISALPWTENFDGMTNVGNSLFPNCWVDESGDWFSDNGNSGTSYTAPNNASIRYGSDDYLWTPEFNLVAGTTYEFAFRWIGDGYSGWNGGVYYSQSQSSASSTQIGTNFISATDISSSTDYKKEIYCFTPTTSGVYSFGIYVSVNYSPNILSFDNFSLRIPSPNAGTNGATTVCQTSGLVDLNSVITISDSTGVWAFSPNPSAITSDTLFNPASIPAGTTNVYYIVGGCVPDTALATINIYPKSNAGTDGTVSTCNYGPLNLFDGLSGNVDLGGQWYNPSSQPIPGSMVNFNGEIAANYNYIYVVSNGVCPNDTSVIEIQLQECAGVDEYELKGFVLYPNPSNGVINIQYSGKGEDVKLDVVDAKGAIVWSKQVQFNDNTTQTIDLSTVENGVYYINMTSKNGGSVMKVIKN